MIFFCIGSFFCHIKFYTPVFRLKIYIKKYKYILKLTAKIKYTAIISIRKSLLCKMTKFSSAQQRNKAAVQIYILNKKISRTHNFSFSTIWPIFKQPSTNLLIYLLPLRNIANVYYGSVCALQSKHRFQCLP